MENQKRSKQPKQKQWSEEKQRAFKKMATLNKALKDLREEPKELFKMAPNR